MELTIFKRPDTKKSTAKKLRIQKNIPGVIYAIGQKNRNIYISDAEIKAVLRKIKPGSLATIIFTLKDGKDKVKAVIKEVQYHLTSYDILHIDFLLLQDKVPVSINVPITCINKTECEGIKAGGTFRQIIRSLKVSCYPKDIPEEFVIDVINLKMNDSIRLSDITVPKTVRPLAKMNEVVVVLGKR
jgi:large subunit ribosomal protein L25